MAEVVPDDALEQILIGLDAEDLNRYKRVCKSWLSLIKSPPFVSRHLNLSYNKDHSNNQLGHRRVSLLKSSAFVNRHLLVGSSNGLVCIVSNPFNSKLMVGNPLTREVRQLTYPPYIGVPLFWGFGYESSTDDYKVIVGARKDENRTCFRLLSLKSNEWRDVGEESYRWFVDRVGVLFNGALHWIVRDQNDNKLIVSFDLSKEEFKEIPQPEDDARYLHSKLGIMKGCLCIFGHSFDDGVWLMKEYNVKESWELLKIPDDEYDIVHTLRLGLPKDEDASWFLRASEHFNWEYIDAPVYVQSLVSPHDSARGLPSSWIKCLGLMKQIPRVVQ